MNSNSRELSVFLNRIGVKHTSKTLDFFENHPDSPNILSVYQTIQKVGINCMTLKLNYRELQHDVPKPCLVAILTRNGVSYRTIIGIDDDGVQMLNEEGKVLNMSREKFIQAWKEIGLIVEPSSGATEENFIQNRLNEIFHKNRSFFGLSAILLIILYSLIFIYEGLSYNHIFLATSIAGLLATIPLLIRVFDDSSPLVQKLCTPNGKKKINCDSVLDSDHAKLFGLISWAEMGLLYFLIQFLFILFFKGSASSSLLSLSGIVGFLYVPYSIGYQWLVIKLWCKLCLFVQLILTLNFVLSIIFWVQNSSIFTPFQSLEEILGLLVISLVTFIGYGLIKPFVLKFVLYSKQFDLTNKLKFDDDIFKSTVYQQESMSFELQTPIGFGNPSGRHQIKIVTNPSCTPCIKLHKKLFNILKGKKDVFVSEYIFTEHDKNSSSYKVGMAMFKLFEENSELAREAAEDYYRNFIGKSKDWLSKYSLNNSGEKYDALLKEHRQWCMEKGVESVPSIYYNGFKLPRLYSVDDLEYIID